MSTTRSASRGVQLVAAISASIAAVAGAVCTGVAASPAASPVASSGPTTYTSAAYPFTIVLPAGWTVTSVAPESTGELFRGPDADARLGSPGQVPGQTAADRVASNREEIVGNGCSSDPADDAPSTLGGEEAIAWTYECEGAVTYALNAIHDGAGFRFSVSVPKDSAADGPALLAQLASGFTFTAAPATPVPSADLAAIDASLQGTWRTEWAPIDLWIASVEAAGLDPNVAGNELWVADMRRATKSRVSLRFEGDQMIQYAAFNDGPDEFGSQATYTLVDSDTIDAIDPSGVYKTSYDFTLQDGVLAIDVTYDSVAVDLVPQTSIFETLPFTRVP